MSAASGLKHVATEPAQLDSKRERRRGNSTRGGSGRASALRRVPSDSDCSVETASLSADSGDRAVRPPPPPVRTSKSRSRRRGSEWEFLEGLKDGQRFDKRPEVFNGYLHKKRKWPLKGWHKRFFVVDGGILVYARSAGDVARGRLHGSVDVGLSVLSAKPRRRRIDIDADEFIYHLRAKTHDAFRTWLHVLKTHRLYRQHLLTFGARESVPKIHAPGLDDMPPNENSSHMPQIHCNEVPLHPSSCPGTQEIVASGNCKFYSSKRKSKSRKKPFCICTKHSSNGKSHFVSLCSWSTRNEKSKLDFSNQIACIKSSIRKRSFTIPLGKNKKQKNDGHKSVEARKTNKRCQANKSGLEDSQINFAITQLVENITPDNQKIRRIKKSTNVIKYKNKLKEPLLKNAYNFVALRDSKRLSSGSIYYTSSYKNRKSFNRKLRKQNMDQLNGMSQYDMMVKKIVQLLFDEVNEEHEILNTRAYLNKVFEELHGTKLSSKNKNTTRELFKYLLEYWLKNTSTFNGVNIEKIKRDIKKKLNKCTSNIQVSNCSVATQMCNDKSVINKTDIFLKEKHKSDLEEILNNIVYKNEPVDIEFDKKYMSVSNLSTEQKFTQTLEMTNSTNISRFKKTLSRLLSKVPVSTETALAILELYLGILDDDGDTGDTEVIKTKSNIRHDVKFENNESMKRDTKEEPVNNFYFSSDIIPKTINMTKVLSTEYDNSNDVKELDSADLVNLIEKHDATLNDTVKPNLFQSINVLDAKKGLPITDIGINILVYTNLLKTVFKNPIKAVDDKVILLLLDNLLPLSKSTAVHRDINNLCLKLTRSLRYRTFIAGYELSPGAGTKNTVFPLVRRHFRHDTL